ncbi:uncharacterized protein C8Q71DRAFT_513326 [Rhodofomes roseus]|uniref:Uncharacterized protein n=1 Tax=Rhodofomes roseus TaxID=34475 RepID=A0ABQ8KMX6_9APHY|nr:uncharacterized protein C8Q71DRAFT_513326 [Rhodofomes roseus]KAH9839469.1 hypothetical protein C8Q71DRAFT_513326 [Rhodofomes roseus]
MSSAYPTPSSSFPDEEDISHAGRWMEDRPAEGGSPGSNRDKGKGKESDEETLRVDTVEEADAEDSEEIYAGADEYPPTKEEEEESRRVEENLRKWEIAERERRKAARESAASGSGMSIVTDVARRASLLWPSSRAKQASMGGVGAHRKLRTTDSDSVPLEDMDSSPGPSRGVTPEPIDDPFATPGQSTLSLALDPQLSAVMTASDTQDPFEDGEQSPTTPKAAKATGLLPSTSLSRAPPPQPLNLPRPRTPPPRAETPHTSRPPEPVAPPVVAPTQQAEEPQEVRWWTEWLCGCSEGPDRGGDHQAGRTNPFE